MKITAYRFEGWIFECPHCGDKVYVDDEDTNINPEDDVVHIVFCEKCKKEFEICIG